LLNYGFDEGLGNRKHPWTRIHYFLYTCLIMDLMRALETGSTRGQGSTTSFILYSPNYGFDEDLGNMKYKRTRTHYFLYTWLILDLMRPLET